MSATVIASASTGKNASAGGGGRLALLYLLVFCSGALALVYEVLWMRRFVTVFGASTPAVAAVLMGMFLGLGLGSWVWGSRAVRSSRPVRLYGWLEVGVGIGAILVELLLHAYDSAYPGFYQALAPHPLGFLAFKTLLAVVALLGSTFCMGGTLPLLAQAMAAESRHLGINLGGIYATNTAGAALGAMSVPVLWLPNLTVSASYAVAIGCSLLVGVIAVVIGAGFHEPLTDSVPKSREPLSPSSSPTRSHAAVSDRALFLLVGLSGTWLFVLQVSWSRMFAQVHENSIYSLSMILAVLLLGLAAGTAAARRMLRRGLEARRLLGMAWVLGGFVVLWTPKIFWALTGGLAYINVPGGWTSYGLRLFWLSLPAVFLPSVCAGMGLPLLMEMAGAAGRGSSGSVVGRLVTVNTFGSILGSIVAAFLLPSLLGLWGTLVATGVAMVIAGGFSAGNLSLRALLGVRGLLILGLAIVSGVLVDPVHLPRTRIRADHGERLVSLAESSHGIVAVVESGNSRRIKLNNFYVLGGTASTGDERMQGHIPLLLHPKPTRVAFLGLGTGITAGAAMLHPAVEQVTAIEIVPEVISAVRDHFAEANLGVVRSPRVEMVAEDARDFLRGSGRQFDVIVGDLFVPWHHGESSLYTLDHFSTVRRGLAPGGLFCQWLPLFQLSEEEFNMIAATFQDVFPHTMVWRGDFAPGQPALALVGQLSDTAIDPGVIERRLREMKPDPSNPFLIHPAAVWMYLAGPLDPAARRFVDAPRNRENQPWLELVGPLRHAGAAQGSTPLFVGRALETLLGELRSRPVEGTVLSRLEPLHQQWRQAGARLCAASIAMSERQQAEAQQQLQQAIASMPPEIRGFFGGSTSP